MFKKIGIIGALTALICSGSALAFTCPCKAFKVNEVIDGYKICAVEKQDEDSSLVQLIPVKNPFTDADQTTINDVQKTLMTSFKSRTGQAPASVECSSDNSVKQGGITCTVKKQ